jgi:hypothetical protein
MADDVRVRLSAEGEAQVTAALGRVVSKAKTAGHEASSGFEKFNHTLEGSKRLLEGLIIAVGIEKLGELAKAGIAAGDELAKMSQKVGASVKNLSALRFAATTSGVDMKTLTVSLTKFNRTTTDFAAGAAPAVKLFTALGITVKDFAGKDSAERLGLVAEKFALLKDSPEKTALGFLAFGRGVAEIIPLLNELGGEGGLEGAIRKAQQFGVLIGDDAARAAQAVQDDFEIIKTQVIAGSTRFIEGLAPALHAAMSDMQEDIGANQDAWKTWGANVGYAIGMTILVVEATVSRIITIFKQWFNAGRAIAGILEAINTVGTASFSSIGQRIGAQVKLVRDQNDKLDREQAASDAKLLDRAEKLGKARAEGAASLPKLRTLAEGEKAPIIPSGKSPAEMEKERLAAIERLQAERERFIDKEMEAEGLRHEVAMRHIDEESKKLDSTLRELEAKGVPQPNRAAEVERFRAALTAAETFKNQEQLGAAALTELKRQEAIIQSDIARHVISQKQGNVELKAIEAQRLPELIKIAAALRAAAEATNDPAAIASARAFQDQLDGLGLKSKEAASGLAELGLQARKAFGEAIASGLQQAIQQGEKFLDVIRNIGAQVAAALASFYLTKTLEAVGLAGFKGGGLVRAADGGAVSGPGTGTSDSIPALVSAGEFVMRAAVVSQPGVLNLLSTMNAGLETPALSVVRGARRFADGGLAAGAGVSRLEGSLTVALEPGLVLRELKSPEGQRMVIRVLSNNPRAGGAALRR